MGRRGPPPKLIEKRNAEGGTTQRGAVSHRPAKRPVVLGQRVVTGEEIKPSMSLSKVAQEMWDTIVVELIGYNIATTLDGPNLTMMCIYWSDFVAANEAIEKAGRYDFGTTGQIRRSPLVADRNEAAKNYLQIAQEYGLTAVARTRLAMLDVTTRSLESDLAARLGVNPRKTTRALTTAKREIEKE